MSFQIGVGSVSNASPRDVSSIEVSFGELSKMLACLLDTATQLHGRLAPVLAPVPPDNASIGSAMGDKPTSFTVLGGLDAAHQKAQCVDSLLRSVLERLQL